MARGDVIIVGGGPSGLACGIEAQKAGLKYLIFEKGSITDSIRRFPRNMVFFSTPELLELGGIPFPSTHTRPTRSETLQYYRRIVEYFQLRLRLHTPVTQVMPQKGGFEVRTDRDAFFARYVIIATGYFDNTNKLYVPGEDLPHVYAYYDEPYAFVHSQVTVIGGRNSAVETALELFRHGAEVSLVHRQDKLGDSVKYWIRPDIENRIRRNEIKAYFTSVVEQITERELHLRNLVSGETTTLPTDFVIKLIGYRPDERLLRSIGIALEERTLIPQFDPKTFETNITGVYIAGSVACGCETWNIFIENGRAHALPIITDISRKIGSSGVRR